MLELFKGMGRSGVLQRSMSVAVGDFFSAILEERKSAMMKIIGTTLQKLATGNQECASSLVL